MTHSKVTKSVFYLSVITNFILLMFVFMNVRPASDEYWYAKIILERGFIDGLIYWISEISSMFIKETSQFIIVGLPTAYLSWEYVGIIGMTVSYIFLNYALFLVIRRFTGLGRKDSFFVSMGATVFYFISLPVLLLIFNTFGLTIVLTEVYADYLVLGWLNTWIAASTTYIVPISLVLILLIKNEEIILSKSKYGKFIKLLSLLIVGGLIGLTNYSTIGVVLIVIILFAIRKALNKSPIFNEIFIFMGVILGTISTFLLGGSRARFDNVVDESKGLYDIFNQAMSGMANDIILFFNPLFSLMPFLFGLAISFVFKNITIKRNHIVFILFLTLSSILVNNVLGALAYKNLWHSIPVLVLSVMFFISLGIISGSAKPISSNFIKSAISIFIGLVLIISSYSYAKAKYDEAAVWEKQYSTVMSCLYTGNFKPDVYIYLAERRITPEYKFDSLYRDDCP